MGKILDFETFKLNKDFKYVYGRGKNYVFPALVVYIRKNRLSYCRIGVTVSKKVGNAVKRNRAKRVIMAAFYETKHLINGYDIVFVARGKTPFVKSYMLKSYMEKVFRNVIQNEKSHNKVN